MDRAFSMGYVKALLDSGQSDREISRNTGIPRSTIGKWRRGKFEANRRQGSGRRSKITPQIGRRIVRAAAANPTVSSSEIATEIGGISKWTVRRHLKRRGLKSVKRPSQIVILKRHMKCRLEWAMRRCLWRERQWSNIIFSDEASVSLASSDGRLRLWLRSAKKVPLGLVLPSMQCGGGRFLIWGAIWTGGRSELHVMRQTVTSDRYIAILDQHVRPHIPTGRLFMDDNATPHTSGATRAFKEQIGLRQLPWPAKSPDLNPIENVWSWMKYRLRKQLQQGDTLQRVETIVLHLWNEIPQQLIDGLISSMMRRVREVIANRGAITHY